MMRLLQILLPTAAFLSVDMATAWTRPVLPPPCEPPRIAAHRTVYDSAIREDGVRAVLGDEGLVLVFDHAGAPWSAMMAPWALSVRWSEDGALLLLHPDNVQVAEMDLPPMSAPRPSSPPTWSTLPAVDPPLAAGGNGEEAWILTRQGWWTFAEDAETADPQWRPHPHRVLDGDTYGTTLELRASGQETALVHVAERDTPGTTLVTFSEPLQRFETFPVGPWIVLSSPRARAVWRQGDPGSVWVANLDRHVACAGPGWSWRRVTPAAAPERRAGLLCSGDEPSADDNPNAPGWLAALTAPAASVDGRSGSARMPSILIGDGPATSECAPSIGTLQGGVWFSTPDGTWVSSALQSQAIHPNARASSLSLPTRMHWLGNTRWSPTTASPSAAVANASETQPLSTLEAEARPSRSAEE